jgi:hypothetical protein
MKEDESRCAGNFSSWVVRKVACSKRCLGWPSEGQQDGCWGWWQCGTSSPLLPPRAIVL